MAEFEKESFKFPHEAEEAKGKPLEAEEEVDNNLLATIRCPRNLGMITDRLPKSQYQPTGLRRSNSMAIETLDKVQG